MKIRKCSWPMKDIIPGDPKAVMLDDRKDKVHDYIGNVEAVRVDELLTWCKTNPDVTALTLATSIENGDFA